LIVINALGVSTAPSMYVNMLRVMTASLAGAPIALPMLDCTPLLSGAPLDDEAAARLAALLRVLADPGRLRILSLIQSQPSHEACVCHLTDSLELSQPTVSHHLRVLYEAGLVDHERRGNWVYYWTVPQVFAELREAFGAPGQASAVAAESASCSADCRCS
jgi:ArsR family transcriptional regulator